MNKAIAVIAVAFSVTGGMGTAHASALPTCTYEDGTTGTECVWSVEVEGVTSLVPACEHEDGNVDGLPCLWFNEGSTYYVTSENYR